MAVKLERQGYLENKTWVAFVHFWIVIAVVPIATKWRVNSLIWLGLPTSKRPRPAAQNHPS